MSTPTTVWRQAFSVDANHVAARNPIALHKAISGHYREHADDGAYSPTFRADRHLLFAASREPARHQRSRQPVAPLGRATKVLTQASIPPTGVRVPGITPIGEPFMVDLATQAGDQLDFRMIVHPTRSVRAEPDPTTGRQGRGRKVTIRSLPDLRDWVVRRFDGAATINPDLSIGRYERAYEADQADSLLIEGHLTVTNPDAMTQLLRDGIGRDRAYGCGLILTRPTP